jgi:hypothetical protein
MAEFSMWWTTGALGDGLNPYTMAQVTKWRRHERSDGFFPGYGNELAPTGAAPNVNIDTGAASVYGYDYDNDSAVAVNIPTPIGDTRIDRIVLRASWAAQTIRVTRIAGIEGGAAPAIVQTPGVTWDEMICQVSITVGGVITVTNERAPSRKRDGHWLPGMIMDWSGTLSGHYPVDPRTGLADTNWHICNGDVEGGVTTPNLADKFVICAGGTYAAGSSGGTATKDLTPTHAVGTLSANTENAHTHGVGTIAAANESTHVHAAGSIVSGNESAHTHGVGTIAGAATQAGNHNHVINADAMGGVMFSATAAANGADFNALDGVSNFSHAHGGLTDATNPAAHSHAMSGTSAAGSAHTHAMSGNSAAGSAHTHVVAGTTAAGSAHTHVLAGATANGGSAVQDIMPPYYALAKICYVGD